MLLLTAGDSYLSVYGDASYMADVSVGAWAYQIPTFGIRAVGLETNTRVERLELLAIVKGMEFVAALDASSRGIHVHTDSTFVLSVLSHLSSHEDLSSRCSFDRVRDLFLQARAALGIRQLKSSKIKGKPVDHQGCHLAARRYLKTHVWDGALHSGAAALKRTEQKLLIRQREYKRLEQQMARLAQQMERAKRELSTAENEVCALREIQRALTLSLFGGAPERLEIVGGDFR
jgi:ribonuclease HI